MSKDDRRDLLSSFLAFGNNLNDYALRIITRAKEEADLDVRRRRPISTCKEYL